MNEIDTERLIQAVKNRPALYDKNNAMYYSHKKHKAALWKEVAKEVHTAWETFRPQDKVECGHELQRRWKSLRTCFTREISLQKKERVQRERNEQVKRRKRYEHYDSMHFLLEVGATADDPRDDDDDDEDDPFDVKNEPTHNVTHQTSPQMTNHPPFNLESEPQILQPMFERHESTDDKILDVLKGIKKSDDDEDRQFMLSLVPSFRKLNDKQKFEARIEILRVLKNITFRNSES